MSRAPLLAPRRALPPAAIIASALVVAGCGEDEAAGGAPPSVVVAVSQDQPLGGRTARIVTRVTIDGGEPLLSSEVDPAALPLEVVVPALPVHTRVTATVEAFDVTGVLLVRRVAVTDVARGRTLLLRTRLQDECVIPGAEYDMTCPGLTCRAGACEMPFVPASRLEDHFPTWAAPAEAACGAVGQGEPSLTIGREAPPFVALDDGEVVTPQMGHQGASHFFFGVRARDVDPASARTVYRGTILSSGRETNAVSVADPYDDGCGLFMIPFVLPPEGASEELMRLDVTVYDHTENAGHGHVEIVLAEPLPPI